MASELTEDVVIAQGGWHPRYARVVLIYRFGDEAVVLVDGNGDGADVESERWYDTPDGWVGGSSQGIGPLEHRPIWTWGEAGGTGFVIGCTPGTSDEMTVEWLSRRSTAVPNALGVWIALFPGLVLPDPPAMEMAEAQGFRRWAPGEWERREATFPKLVTG